MTYRKLFQKKIDAPIIGFKKHSKLTFKCETGGMLPLELYESLQIYLFNS